MDRIRNIPIALKTTQEVKESLSELTTIMSKDVGCNLTQTQVIEKLIANALRPEETVVEDITTNGHVANHGRMLCLTGNDSPALAVRMQFNANRVADEMNTDIKIDEMMYCLSSENEELTRMRNIFYWVLGSNSRHEFKDEQLESYYNKLVELSSKHNDLGGLIDHVFVIFDAYGNLKAVGSAPYVSTHLRRLGKLKSAAKMLQSLLEALLNLAVEERVFGCNRGEFKVRVLAPADSIYAPDIKDDNPFAFTIMLCK